VAGVKFNGLLYAVLMVRHTSGNVMIGKKSSNEKVKWGESESGNY
jgi:hypothetical protein